MAFKHWGDISSDEAEEPPSLTDIEREQIVKLRQVDVVGAKLYKPCYVPPQVQTFEDTIPCKRTLHTIQLLKCHKKLAVCYDDLYKQKFKKKRKKNPPVIPDIPDIPDASHIPPRKITIIPKSFPESLALNLPIKNSAHNDSSPIFINQDYFERSNFAQGIGETPLLISGPVAYKVLQKAVATICAHAGFDAATDIVLDNLTDAVRDFFTKLCERFRHHAFHKLHPEPTLFPDAIECAFQEMGLGSLITLDKFYVSRVIQYHDKMMRNCNILRRGCEILRNMVEDPKKLCGTSSDLNAAEGISVDEPMQSAKEDMK